MSNPYQSPYSETSTPNGKVVISDIDIPFGRLIIIMLKTMLASIPAVIVMYAIMFAIIMVIALVFGGLGALTGGFPRGPIGN